jgi:hypothetical protein
MFSLLNSHTVEFPFTEGSTDKDTRQPSSACYAGPKRRTTYIYSDAQSKSNGARIS